MAQPSFVPITEADQVRAVMQQPTPTYVAGRPSELRQPVVPHGKGFGKPGPDQGYALKLAHGLKSEIVLQSSESLHDVEVGTALLGARRASLYGRAPSVYDLKVALGIFGFLVDAPDDLVAYRLPLFQAVSHRWEAQRVLVDSVPEEALRLSPDEARSSVTNWKATLR